MIYVTQDDGRELLAVEVRDKGISLGWVAAADWHAFVDGNLDEAGIRRLAALQPEPPADASVIRPAPSPFLVEPLES